MNSLTDWLMCLAVFCLMAGCGGGEDAPPPAAMTPVPPKPIAAPPPPPTAVPAAPAVVAQAPVAGGAVSTNPDAMTIVSESPRYTVAGLFDASQAGEKLVGTVPTGNPDTFVIVKPGARPVMTSLAMAKSLPKGFVSQPEFGVHESGYPMRIVSQKDQTSMVLVPAGVFVMGTNTGPDNASPEHPMLLDAFYIDVYETTVADYMQFREEQKKEGKGRIPSVPTNVDQGQDFPAVGVNWSEARLYAKWAEKDLPTEAEWEKAARGTTGFAYPWGSGRPAWKDEKRLDELERVGQEPTDVSAFGVCDLAGNAQEWCLDYYAADAFDELAASTKDVARNWGGPRTSSGKSLRVLKGNGPDWKLWHRDGLGVTENKAGLGFRCVLRLYELETR